MKKSHPAFWGAGLAGLFVGAALALLGLVGASESAQLAGGYGLMLAGSGLYLLAGLGLKRTLMNRAAPAPRHSSMVPIGSQASANQS